MYEFVREHAYVCKSFRHRRSYRAKQSSPPPPLPSKSPCFAYLLAELRRAQIGCRTRNREGHYPVTSTQGAWERESGRGRLNLSKQDVARKRPSHGLSFISVQREHQACVVSFMPGRDRCQLLQSRPAWCHEPASLAPVHVTSRRAAGLCSYGDGITVVSPAHTANNLPLRVPVLLTLA